jgi:hypothetical protein
MTDTRTEAVAALAEALAAAMDPTASDSRDVPGRWTTEWKKAQSWAHQYAGPMLDAILANPAHHRALLRVLLDRAEAVALITSNPELSMRYEDWAAALIAALTED